MEYLGIPRYQPARNIITKSLYFNLYMIKYLDKIPNFDF